MTTTGGQQQEEKSLSDVEKTRAGQQNSSMSPNEQTNPKEWTGPDDRDNPQNWNTGAKVYHATIPALFGFAV
jgi:hypothetical protein